ncbi:MAG TPA: hypothetical protein VL133_05200 [Devosia sp.]|nr:hypothetical protein [Devosia sp.]
MAKTKPTTAAQRRVMPAKGGTSVRQARPGEFPPAPVPAEPVVPEEEQ